MREVIEAANAKLKKHFAERRRRNENGSGRYVFSVNANAEMTIIDLKGLENETGNEHIDQGGD